eukprot:168655-Chlamydomonas_euryale.AAC.3
MPSNCIPLDESAAHGAARGASTPGAPARLEGDPHSPGDPLSSRAGRVWRACAGGATTAAASASAAAAATPAHTRSDSTRPQPRKPLDRRERVGRFACRRGVPGCTRIDPSLRALPFLPPIETLGAVASQRMQAHAARMTRR